MPAYAELHCVSSFTFLRGASQPQELVTRAAELGYYALAITDECSVAGVVQAHLAVRDVRDAAALAGRRSSLKLIVGSEFRLEDDLKFVLLATDRTSYGGLAHLITAARQTAEKGAYRLTRQQLEGDIPEGCIALWIPAGAPNPRDGEWLSHCFPGHTWIAVELLLTGDDRQQLRRLQDLGRQLSLPLCASGDVHMHARNRRVLQDTLTAIRMRTPLHELGSALFANGERHLRARERLARMYPRALLEETVAIAKRCHFSLEELRYEYPQELVPKGRTPHSWLRRLTVAGMRRRWPQGAPTKVRRLVEHELKLVQELRYAPYFLTVHDIVAFARSQGILCQGRGSAANSAICYCLGITEVDPARMNLLFERFISRERNEPPDIDVDFEHERREQVIQYIYRKYGRHRAALASTVVTYRPRSAVRDVGKALGMSLNQVDGLAKSIQWWDGRGIEFGHLGHMGLETGNPIIKRLRYLVRELMGFPRHLSQHVGGFVITAGPLSRLVPIENAAMPERTVIQWEKHDLEALGLLKVDILGLGMLTAIHKALGYISDHTGRRWAMADIPAEDPAVYRMLRRADTVGVFQIESRAQMSMLPRLKPRCYYDLVVEIAIVRPGPIQGQMVHPYLRRRSGKEPVAYPSEEVKRVLERTLGVPIFQEQVMQLSIIAAGFTPGEADQLRRGMAAWRRRGGLQKFQHKLMQGMRDRGYDKRFAKQICQQIEGFGEYGFPESHSASFALLAYVSSWLKHHYPAAFTCALLNSQPMGFYAPAQLIQDARRHGVRVRPVDVRYSSAGCTLEPLADSAQPALRLGLCLVKGLSRAGITRLLVARERGWIADLQDLKVRAGLDTRDLDRLAAAGALAGLAGHRHRAFWEVTGVSAPTPLLPHLRFAEGEPLLRRPREGEDIVADYASMGLSLGRHPLALLRPQLSTQGIRQAEEFWGLANGSTATAAGLVICRQRPGSASGVIFLTLEDETGHVNVVLRPSVIEAQRRPLLQSRLLAVTGAVQQEDGVLHLIAARLRDLTSWLGQLPTQSRDFQ